MAPQHSVKREQQLVSPQMDSGVGTQAKTSPNDGKREIQQIEEGTGILIR
jgi:hypothetical protein